MINILQSELFRIRHRAQTWIMLAISAGFAVLFYAGFAIAHAVNPDSSSVLDGIDPANVSNNGLVIAQLVAPVLVVVFGAGLVGSEFGWNTMRPLIARSRSRTSLLSAKWGTVVIFTIVLTLATIVITFGSAVAASTVSGQGTGFNGDLVSDMIGSVIRYSAALILSAALAMVLALVFRSNAVGIAAGIAITLIEPILFLLLRQLSDVFGTIEKGSLTYNINRLMQYGGDTDVTVQDAWKATGILGVWLVVLAAISFVVFNRRDVTSG